MSLKAIMQTEQFKELKEYLQRKVASSLDVSLIFNEGKLNLDNERVGEQAKVKYEVYLVLKSILEEFEDISKEKVNTTNEDVARKFGLD